MGESSKNNGYSPEIYHGSISSWHLLIGILLCLGYTSVMRTLQGILSDSASTLATFGWADLVWQPRTYHRGQV